MWGSGQVLGSESCGKGTRHQAWRNICGRLRCHHRAPGGELSRAFSEDPWGQGICVSTWTSHLSFETVSFWNNAQAVPQCQVTLAWWNVQTLVMFPDSYVKRVCAEVQRSSPHSQHSWKAKTPVMALKKHCSQSSKPSMSISNQTWESKPWRREGVVSQMRRTSVFLSLWIEWRLIFFQRSRGGLNLNFQVGLIKIVIASLCGAHFQEPNAPVFWLAETLHCWWEGDRGWFGSGSKALPLDGLSSLLQKLAHPSRVDQSAELHWGLPWQFDMNIFPSLDGLISVHCRARICVPLASNLPEAALSGSRIYESHTHNRGMPQPRSNEGPWT